MEGFMNFTKYWVLGLLLIFTVFGAYFEEPETYTYSGRSYTSLAPQASDHLTDPAWQFDLAWSYKEAAMFDEALRHIRRAVELNPEMAFLYAKTADIFSEMGSRIRLSIITKRH